jgi:trehalose 6-phosphate synthase/phosphatase
MSEHDGRMVLKRSVGGLATALNSVASRRNLLWIGWPGTDRLLSRKELADLKFPKELVPVQIPKRLLTGYYHRLANGVLWPLMHGLKPAIREQPEDLAATEEVIERFTRAVEANWRPDDTIWIHDFHLMLLPKSLRLRGVDGRIGFFVHTPFPKPEVFMAWPHHRQALESLAAVDVLGLQTPRDVRNFKACLTQAGLAMRSGATVRSFPIGVDFSAYRTADALAEVKGFLRSFRSLKRRGSQLVLSVSRLDYTKGILQQLAAVESALERYRPAKLHYKLVVAPSRDELPEYRALKDKIEHKVWEINAKYREKWHYEPVSYEYRSYGFEELNALYRLADVLLVTPVIDGMNLVVKEYVAARGAQLGAIVLSRTAGVAFQLRDGVIVEPGDARHITQGLVQALEMPLVEQAWRWQSLYRNVRQQDVFWWAGSFLAALERRGARRAPQADTQWALNSAAGQV